MILIFASIHWLESGSGKHFQASGIRAIDSPHWITLNGGVKRRDYSLKKNFLPKQPIQVYNHAKNRLRAFPKRENASLTLIQGIDVCIEAKIEKFSNFSLKIIFLEVISCGESIARVPKAWKRFLDPDSGKLVQGRCGLIKQSLESGHRFLRKIWQK